MSDDVAGEVRLLVSDVFNVALSDVSSDSSQETIASWDSMQHLNLVLALEQRFDIQIMPEEIEQMTNVGMVACIIRQKVVPGANA